MCFFRLLLRHHPNDTITSLSLASSSLSELITPNSEPEPIKIAHEFTDGSNDGAQSVVKPTKKPNRVGFYFTSPLSQIADFPHSPSVCSPSPVLLQLRLMLAKASSGAG